MAWTLQTLRREVRQITGFVSSSQIEDSEINDFINRFYQNTLPSELNLPSLSSFWNFNTRKNVDTYSNPTSNYTLDNPATINGEPAVIYTDASFFYNDYPQYFQRQNIGSGTGTVSNYTGILSDVTIYASTGITITDSIETFTYVSLAGDVITLTGDLGGTATVNRVTGAYNITFNSNVPLNNNIYISYEYYTPEQPISLLLYGNQVTLRPIPDSVYSIKVAISSVPTALTLDTSTLIDDSWGELISYGASRDILNARNSQLAAQNIFSPYMEAKSRASIKFIKQNNAARVAPSF
jgi:hypothetical protein